MLKGRHKDLHPLLKVVEWLCVMLVCMLAVFGIWYLLPVNPASTGALLLFQALQSIALFIVPPLIVAWLWSGAPLRWLRVSGEPSAAVGGKTDWQLVGLSVAIMVTAVPLINCLVSWNQAVCLPECLSGLEQMMRQMEDQADRLLQSFMTYQDGAWWVLVLNLIVLAVLPAVGEELTFRGVLQGLIERSKLKIERAATGQAPQQNTANRSHVAVWVTAFVFSFVHFQFYGFIPRLLLGALLGYSLMWSGRIGYSMIMHATNNALSVLVFYLGTYVWNLPQGEMDAIGTHDTWWLTAVCTPVAGVLMYLFYKRASVANSAAKY